MADGSPNLPRDTLATAQVQRKMAGPEGGDCLSHHQLAAQDASPEALLKFN
jgi:hypothetical protein